MKVVLKVNQVFESYINLENSIESILNWKENCKSNVDF